MSPENDPFDRLRTELRRAAELRAEPARTGASSPRRLGRLSRRSGVAAVIATGIVASAAAAAVVATNGSPSAPSAGPLTRATPTTGAPTPAPTRVTDLYSISIYPSLKIGEVGWCSAQTIRNGNTRRPFGGTGCGPAATTAQPFIAGGYTTVDGGRLTFAIVDDQITALKLKSGRSVTPRPGVGIPNGWKVFVLLPGENDQGAEYLDRNDEPVDGSIGPGKYVTTQPTTTTKGAAPAGSSCRVTVRNPGAVLRSVTLREKPQPAPNVNGRAFLPCAAAVISRPGGEVTATVLVDAQRPGDTPADLPGTRPIGGAPGLVESDPDLIGNQRKVARRVGSAWLVIEPGDQLTRFPRPDPKSRVNLREALEQISSSTD